MDNEKCSMVGKPRRKLLTETIWHGSCIEQSSYREPSTDWNIYVKWRFGYSKDHEAFDEIKTGSCDRGKK